MGFGGSPELVSFSRLMADSQTHRILRLSDPRTNLGATTTQSPSPLDHYPLEPLLLDLYFL